MMYGSSSLLGMIASPIGGMIAVKMGEKRLSILSLGAGYICLLAAFLKKGVWLFMGLYLAYRFFGILAMPAMAAITANLSPPKQMGMGYALSFMPSSVVGVVAPMIAGYLADPYGYFPTFMSSIVILYMGLGILQLGVRIR
jgi:MFS family permease